MGGTLRNVVVGLGAAALAVTALQAPSSGADRSDRSAYPQPKAGSWKFKDSFGHSSGTLTVKAGLKGKNPAVKTIRFTAKDPRGAGCPETGATVKVKGSFALRKAPKWAEDDFDNIFAWISAKKDKPYDDDSPNMLGMKPVPATVTFAGEERDADLAISFKKLDFNKPHALDLEMRVYPADDSGGYCLFEGSGKPGK